MSSKVPVGKSSTMPAFERGQVWRLADSSIEIGLVGNHLVHYKHYRGELKRAPLSLSGKATLKKYLLAKKAVLVTE